MIEKRRKQFIILFFGLIFVFTLPASASPAPDRFQQIYDLLSAECQKLYRYAELAQNGDTGSFESVKQEFAVTVDNIAFLMDEEGSIPEVRLRSAWQNFEPDAGSAFASAEICSAVFADIDNEQKQKKDSLQEQSIVNSYETCVSAGYHTDNGTCFIGGSPVFDSLGNLIGYYYADCYDANGFHPGSCWDCFYGADNSGCLAKP